MTGLCQILFYFVLLRQHALYCKIPPHCKICSWSSLSNIRCWCRASVHARHAVKLTSWFNWIVFTTDDADSAIKVVEKLEELSVKDKKEGEKVTEKKEESKQVKAEEKNWERRTFNTGLQLIRFPLFSTIDSKWTQFGHLTLVVFFCWFCFVFFPFFLNAQFCLTSP